MEMRKLRGACWFALINAEPPKFELAAIMAELKEIRDVARKIHDSLVEKLNKQTKRIEKMESEQSEMNNKIALQDAAIASLNQQVDDMIPGKTCEQCLKKMAKTCTRC
jgi:predicted nuclease with TOPRIM domain